MRNTSIFNGVKELRELTFMSDGEFWKVYEDHGSSLVFIGIIKKISRESNIKLYNRACDSLIEAQRHHGPEARANP